MCIVKSDACGPETQEINFLGAFKAVKKKKKPTAVEWSSATFLQCLELLSGWMQKLG